MSAAVIAAARGWLGTPYRHRASLKGAGCDCLGLIRGVWRELKGAEPLPLPPYDPGWAEAAGEERLWHAARACLTPRKGEAQPGDVLLFRMRERAVAKHLGIHVGGRTPRFVHAYSGFGVVESPLSRPWQRRIVAAFSFDLT